MLSKYLPNNKVWKKLELFCVIWWKATFITIKKLSLEISLTLFLPKRKKHIHTCLCMSAHVSMCVFVCVYCFLLLRYLILKGIPLCTGKIFSFYIDYCTGDVKPPTKSYFNVKKILSWLSLNYEMKPQVPRNKTLNGFFKE